MRTITSAGIWVLSTALTILLFLVELVLTVILFPFDKKRKINHSQCYWWSSCIIGLNPYWNVEVKGRGNIDPKETYVIVANHQSLADIVIMYETRMQFKWVAKDSLFKVPFIGWCLSLTKHIRLARGEHGSIKKVYREASSWLKRDMSVLFFPEGTRSQTGRMGEFQNGAFKLAIKEGRPILPIVVNGTRDAIPKGSWLFENKVNGSLTILPKVETSDLKMGDFLPLKDSIRKAMEPLVD